MGTVYRWIEGGWFVTYTVGQGSFRGEVLGAEVALDKLYADTPV